MSNLINIKKNLLKDYIIKGVIGKGTFSEVKLGIDKKTKEKVAIKILEKNKITNTKDIIRIEREIDIIKSIDHINVIKVYKILQDPEKIYIIMEYCENGELFNRIIDEKKLPEEECSFFYYQLINGLEYIHSKQIIHRDLKPENLLLTKNDTLKIIDFGLSNYNTFDNLLSTPCGSPCYASPEMVTGEKYNGFMLDIWSSGIILYAMIYGTLPFQDGDNNTDLLFQNIQKCKIKFNKSECNLGVDLLKKILVPDPEKRYNISQIKIHPFYKKGKSIFLNNQKIIENDNIENNINNNVINSENNFIYKIMKNKINNTANKSLDTTKGLNLRCYNLTEEVPKNRVKSHNKTSSEDPGYKLFKKRVDTSIDKIDPIRNLTIKELKMNNNNFSVITENEFKKRKNKLNQDKMIRINMKGMVPNNISFKDVINDKENNQSTSRNINKQVNFPNNLSTKKVKKNSVKTKSNSKNLKISYLKNELSSSNDNSKIICNNKINNSKTNTSYYTYKSSRTTKENKRNTFDSYYNKNNSNNNIDKKREQINSIENIKRKKNLEMCQELNQSFVANNNIRSNKQPNNIINTYKIFYGDIPHKNKSQTNRFKKNNNISKLRSPEMKPKKNFLNHTNSLNQKKYNNQNEDEFSYPNNKYINNNSNNNYDNNYEKDYEVNYKNNYDNDYYGYNNKYNNNSIKIITENRFKNNSSKNTPKLTSLSRNPQKFNKNYNNNNLIVINNNIYNNTYNNNKIINVNYRNISFKKRDKLNSRETEEKVYEKNNYNSKRDNYRDYNNSRDINISYNEDYEKKKDIIYNFNQKDNKKKLLKLNTNVSKISTLGMINMFKANISTIPCFTIDMNNLNKNNDKYQKYYDAIKNKL